MISCDGFLLDSSYGASSMFSVASRFVQALSLWNCTPVGPASFLAYDLSLRCEGAEYRRMSAFNVAFVVGVVVGWPAFLVWYLRRIQLQERTADDWVLSRVGFLFEQYRPEYLYWDVVETVRKLYLVTVVAFFESGSMLQLVLSVIVSSLAFAYHVYALPYVDQWLNVLQGAYLFMIWASLQAGMLMVTAQPNPGAGSALLTAISVANIVMLISPVLLIVLVMLQLVPASIRARFSAVLGLSVGPNDVSVNKSGSEGELNVGVAEEAFVASTDDSSVPHSEHADSSLNRRIASNDPVSHTTGTTQLEMVNLVSVDIGTGPVAHGSIKTASESPPGVNPLFALATASEVAGSPGLTSSNSDRVQLFGPDTTQDHSDEIAVSRLHSVLALASSQTAAVVQEFIAQQSGRLEQQDAQLKEQRDQLEQLALEKQQQGRVIEQLVRQVNQLTGRSVDLDASNLPR